ncbi:DUF5777 family beta-barrel protein [Sunxiuqinia elliptica]|uniref:DUF5777 domain-containing protein n=1 Tax=Sunxiuqinia elliptica TaxID=655355 RepID=A0A1I2HI16_9BACT|nr:DUF5777 family beta-barrel protein [Sunxiuqinia elliptica]SFF29329.1 hypothetical protein SAMN05216283_104104 [Sunxiuqinia elliptica]
MKNIILFILLGLFVSTNLFAQDEATEEKEKDKPVRFAWESGVLIDQQTSHIPTVKTLKMVIQHKFGPVENGHSDLWGIYAPAGNIRLGLNYVVANNVEIGWGISKRKMYNDFNAKWTILEQTRKNQIPVFVTLYGNAAIEGSPEEDFGTEYQFSDRLSYFSQLIIGRKVTDGISLQAGLSFSHANSVAPEYDHDRVGLHFNGRAKVSPQGAIIFNFDAPLKIDKISEQRPEWDNHPKPNLSFGYEVSTSTHAFQIYMGNSEGMLLQDIMMNNFNSTDFDNFAIGFTITRLWSF